MAAWGEGLATGIGGASEAIATFTMQGMTVSIGGESLISEPYIKEAEVVVEDVSTSVPHYFSADAIEISVTPESEAVPHYYFAEASEVSTVLELVVAPHYKYSAEADFSVISDSTVTPHYHFANATKFVVVSDSSNSFYCGIPYLIKAIVTIDTLGKSDYSDDLLGAVNVTKSDGSAATFSFTLNFASTPSDLVGKEVKISYQAADETGLVANAETIIIGVVREVRANPDSPTLIEISGYDYGGYHNELGQLYSGDVTPILTGTVGITTYGLIDTGFSPIMNVTYVGALLDVKDGTDYLVSALDGKIWIPYTSKLLTSPSSLSFQYGDYFGSFDALAQAIAGIKGWELSYEGFSVSDYTAINRQPILSLSNESIIDTLKKLFEIGGAKLDSSLYPELRIYNDKINYDAPALQTFTENGYVWNSAQMQCSLFDALTDQTVKSVQNTFSDVTENAPEELENQSGSFPIDYINGWHYEDYTTRNEADIYSMQLIRLAGMPRKTLKEIIITKKNLSDVSFISTGGGQSYRFINITYGRVDLDGLHPLSIYGGSENPPYHYVAIWTTEPVLLTSIAGDWEISTNVDGDILLTLSVAPIIVGHDLYYPPPFYQYHWPMGEQRGVDLDEVKGYVIVGYPQVDWNIVVNANTVEYGEGVSNPQVEVSGTQLVQKIDIKLEGDVYEQAFVETQAHGEDLCKAILHERGFVYSASASLPLHRASGLKLGDKKEILSRGRSVLGNLKSISYDIDTTAGSGIVGIEVKGKGTGI